MAKAGHDRDGDNIICPVHAGRTQISNRYSKRYKATAAAGGRLEKIIGLL
jgi:hypothetical protein